MFLVENDPSFLEATSALNAIHLPLSEGTRSI